MASNLFQRGPMITSNGGQLATPEFINRAQSAKMTLTSSGGTQTGNVTDALTFGSDTIYKRAGTSTTININMVFDLLEKQLIKSFLFSGKGEAPAGKSWECFVDGSDDSLSWTNLATDVGVGTTELFDLVGGDVTYRYIRFKLDIQSLGGNTSNGEYYTVQFTV